MRRRRYSYSRLMEPRPRIDLDGHDVKLPNYLTRGLREVRDLILKARPDAKIEVVQGYYHDDPDDLFYIVATIDVDDIDELRPIDESYFDRLCELQIDEDLPITVVTLPFDSEKAWSEKNGAVAK